MRGTQSVGFSGISLTTAAFELNGGVYVLSAVATFGGGSVAVEMLLPDGTTWGGVTNGSLAAAGTSDPLYLPPGQYRIAIATATAVIASLSRVPFE